MPDFESQIKSLTTRPGVYLFRGADGAIIYVGKAKRLRNRVRSYFRPDARSGSRGMKTAELVRHIESIDTIIVSTEAEALILEANLIKEHQPRFNLHLRDDKSYPYIKVTTQERFPRVYVTRRVVNDGGRYFGPYTKVGSIRQALEVVKRLYTVRSCRYNLPADSPDRPCLDYHIGRCLGPCVGEQSEAEYGAMVTEILQVLSGNTEEIRSQVEGRMRAASEALDFEQAAKLRDTLAGLDALGSEQRVQRWKGGDWDVIGIARDGELAVGVVMRIRNGTLLGRDVQRFSGIIDESDAALVESFANGYYLGGGSERNAMLPSEILLPDDFDDRELLESVLSERAGRAVTLRSPQRGEKKRLVGLAEQNARHALEDRVAALAYAADRADDALYALQEALDLKVVPRLMVCFDISHIQGSETVASAVVFQNGEPKKAEYRHMRIQGEWGNDDYASMAEAVSRYHRRRLDEEKPIPDLVLIDGGKGQLGAAIEALETVRLAGVGVAALAKREEEVFLPGRSEPVLLDRRDRALHVLQRMRDEAHRFALRYNRKLRRSRTLRSDLGSIPGIGPRRQQVLLKRFGSLKGVKSATVEEIARVPGFSEGLATKILTYLGRS